MLQRLDQCYSDILQVKIKFVMIFIVSGMEDFQTWKPTHDSKHLDVQTYHSISTDDHSSVHLMRGWVFCVTFTVSRASAGRPRCRWRSGSDEGGGLCQSRLSRAPAKGWQRSVLYIDTSLLSSRERNRFVQNSDRSKSYSVKWWGFSFFFFFLSIHIDATISMNLLVDNLKFISIKC